MTLTTALHLHRGGSPKGPAGTGKTETVKDLGKALGMYVIVVNCSEGLDYKSMGRMYSGLAQVGRISTIATQSLRHCWVKQCFKGDMKSIMYHVKNTEKRHFISLGI